MDALRLNLSLLGDADGLIFDFGRLAGDAETGTETGFVKSITLTGGINLIGPTGGSQFFNYPSNISNVSYTYTKTSPNSGTITISGDGVLNSYPSIFVNFLDGSRFEALLDVTFGSAGGTVGNVGVSVSVNTVIDTDPGTVVAPADGGNAEFFGGTARQGFILTLQSGGSVPLGYNLDDSSGVARTVAENIADISLAEAGRLDMENSSGGAPNYLIDTIVISDDRGFSDVDEQGIAGLTIGTAAKIETSYGWKVVDGFNNVADLILEYTAAGATSSTTERYRFTFASTETGTYQQLQPATGNTGTFNLPFLDTPTE